MKAKWLLRITCLWTFLVWSVLVKNMITAPDHELGFRIVHITLALVSIGLAIAVWPLSSRLGNSSKG